MIIKKFQGKTKEEALESARKELGEGIVEMNVKAIKAKGIMSLFKGTRFEVTVAKEEENEKNEKSVSGFVGIFHGCFIGLFRVFLDCLCIGLQDYSKRSDS